MKSTSAASKSCAPSSSAAVPKAYLNRVSGLDDAATSTAPITATTITDKPVNATTAAHAAAAAATLAPASDSAQASAAAPAHSASISVALSACK